MFDSILIRGGRSHRENFDAGQVAEAMLFYRQVKLVCYYGTLTELLNKIPPFILLDALKEDHLQIYYAHEQPVVMTDNTGTKHERYDFARVGLVDIDYPEVVQQAFYEAAGKTPQAKIGSKKFAKLVKQISYEGFDSKVLVDETLDNNYIGNVVKDVVNILAPEYPVPPDLYFNASSESNKIALDTNIDFQALNKSYQYRTPIEHSTVTPAFLLSFIQHAHLDIYFSSKLTSEIATSDVSSKILSRRFANVLSGNKKNSDSIEMFSDLVLENGRAIREAINSGQCSWVAYLKLLDHSKKFRHWLDKQPPDASLVKEYMKEAFTKTWLEQTPVKIIRWALFNGLGFVADKAFSGSGIAISAFDSYLFDKIVGGWKPHHFIENRVKPLINGIG